MLEGRVLSEAPSWLAQSDYNPVEEPSWNSAASFALQNGASWLSPLGSGALVVSPTRGASQREQSEVRTPLGKVLNTEGHFCKVLGRCKESL